MSTSEPTISVQGVSKRFRLYHERNQSLKSTIMRWSRGTYEEFWALRDVTFEVQGGTTLGLIGENGSGKSTMLKCLSRILRPDEGSISIQGKPSALLELGAGFHPELSGRENVFLNGSILGLPQREIERRFDDIVAFAGLERFIDTPVKNYSSGMYVRLGFSVAINVDPDVLLVDEVLAVGDEQFQRKCLERVSDMRAAGKTIVVVTHSLGTVRTLCDEAVWLDHGVLKAHGPAGAVADAYLSNVHLDSTAGPTDGGRRWGSGEVRLNRVELLDERGHATDQIRTGDAVTFRLHYSTARRVSRPAFALSIFTIEGIQVTAPHTQEAGVGVEAIEGEGTVDLRIDRALLLPGTYDVTVNCTDAEGAHTYDHRDRVIRFDVKPGTPHETMGGFVSMDGRWTIS